MAGAMRKMAVYLGLVEDEAGLYDEYGPDGYGYEEDESTRADVRPESRQSTRTLQPVRDEAAAPARASVARIEPSSTPTGSPRCTRAPTTTRGPWASTSVRGRP